jgi:hypothetical protein
MNMGFLEGHDLGSALERILNEAASMHYLDGYNAVWTRRWRQLQGLDAEFVATPETDEWIAENAHRLLPCLPAQGRELQTLAAHLGLVLNPVRAQASAS